MSNYEWRHEMIEKIERNGKDINGNPRFVLTLGMAGMTKRVTVAGKYWTTNGLSVDDKGSAHVFMNWDTGRAKYVMFKNPASYHDFRQVTFNNVRAEMTRCEAPMQANALHVLLSALDMMEDTYYQHDDVDSAYRELRVLLTNIPAAEELYLTSDEAMVEGLEMVDDYLLDMDLWWHNRVTDSQLDKLTTYRSGLLNPQEQGFTWAY